MNADSEKTTEKSAKQTSRSERKKQAGITKDIVEVSLLCIIDVQTVRKKGSSERTCAQEQLLTEESTNTN